LAASDAVTVVSSAELRRLQTEGYMPQSAKVRVVPSPIDVQRIRQAVLAQDRSAARRSFGVRETDSAIVWFGRMEPGKDPELAIRTTELLLERLNGSYRPPVLLLAGDGSLVAELRRRIASSKHAANLRMVGRLDDVTPLLAAADIALFTSESEGFGLALVEAGAAGVPLVTTEVGAAPDLLRGGAKPLSQCLATARDVEGFAGKAAALLSIPAVDRNALADALRHRALGFDSPQVWQRMREIYLDAPDADNARASVDQLCA
jgi:glycosyltransferase involved in cell wall biosynthesis